MESQAIGGGFNIAKGGRSYIPWHWTNGGLLTLFPLAVILFPMNLFSKNRRVQRQRFYNHRIWKQIRKIQLSKRPLCESCQKNCKQSVATVCDHKNPLWNNWTEFIKGPFQSLCEDCHNEKTKTEDYSKLIKAEKLKIQTVDF